MISFPSIRFFGSTDRLITTGNRQQTTTDPVHSHGEINRSRHRHRLKKGLRWLTFSTDVSKLLIIGCFVCSHDKHHFLTLCQIYSITDKVQHSLQTRNLNLTATNEIRLPIGDDTSCKKISSFAKKQDGGSQKEYKQCT